MLHLFTFSTIRLLREMKTITYQFTNCSMEWPLLTRLTTKRDRGWPFRTFRLLYSIPASERKKGSALDRGCLFPCLHSPLTPHHGLRIKCLMPWDQSHGTGSIGAGTWCFQVYSRNLAWQWLDPAWRVELKIYQMGKTQTLLFVWFYSLV